MNAIDIGFGEILHYCIIYSRLYIYDLVLNSSGIDSKGRNEKFAYFGTGDYPILAISFANFVWIQPPKTMKIYS